MSPADHLLIETIKKRADFLSTDRGKRVAKPAFVVLGRKRVDGSEIPLIRFGLTVSRKNGNAVIRNRIRRRLRALAHQSLPTHGKAGWDYVLIARGGTDLREFAALRHDLETALEMLHKARQGA